MEADEPRHRGPGGLPAGAPHQRRRAAATTPRWACGCCARETLEAARSLAQRAGPRQRASARASSRTSSPQAMAQAEERARHARGLVLYSEDWHPGVIGIVASRVVERFHRPTVMVAVKDGMGRGSARSIEAFHLYDALAGVLGTCSSASAGTSTPPGSRGRGTCRAFAEAFEALACAAADAGGPGSPLPGGRGGDAGGAGRARGGGVAALGPFGNGQPRAGVRLAPAGGAPRVLPNKRAGSAPGHLKLTLEAAPHVDAIGFGMADRLALDGGAGGPGLSGGHRRVERAAAVAQAEGRARLGAVSVGTGRSRNPAASPRLGGVCPKCPRSG